MKPICLALLSATFTVILADAALPTDDKKADEKKVVKRIWFPRFSPDGTQVLAAHGGWDKKEGGEVRLFSAKDGKVEHVFPHPRGVRTVAWSTKGAYFVTGGYGFGIRGFDVKEKKELFQLASDRQVQNLRIASDDKFLVASFGAGDIRLYDLASKKEVHHFDAVHDGGIWGMALSPKDLLLATGG
jgi:WD40 repeat protein